MTFYRALSNNHGSRAMIGIHQMRAITKKYTVSVAVGSSLLVLTLPGCKSPQKHREEADKTAYNIIEQKQQEAASHRMWREHAGQSCTWSG